MSPFEIVPQARPDITRDEALVFAKPYMRDDDKVFLLGRRGYYRDTMGETGKNDLNIYDDAICLVTPSRCIPYNANTDPSKHHQGVAVLQPGRWLFRIGKHGVTHLHPYEALIQAGSFVVYREGTEDQAAGQYIAGMGFSLGKGMWRGDNFAINNHKGSRDTTSSEGCQTIHPSQWGDYIEKVKSTMQYYAMLTIPYILTARESAMEQK